MSFLARFLATGFFTGYFPFGPGTAGSLLAVLLYAFIPSTDTALFLPAVLFFLLVGRWSAYRVEQISGVKDNQVIVIDEVVGMWVSLLFMPKRWPVLLLALLLFRFFDILKPFPVRRSEAMPSGWGVMMDDLIAGAYAWLALKACLLIFARF